MIEQNPSIILKFDQSTEQTVGYITKIVGLVKSKHIIPMIDVLDLKANPRSSKTGPVTRAIQESIEADPNLFPFKTKGVLLASSRYEKLDRGRIKIMPDNFEIEGILDGGHNTLAIGLYILKRAMNFKGENFPKGEVTWDRFKELWLENRETINQYQESLRNEDVLGVLNFYVPIELLVPSDGNDFVCVEKFKNDLLEICEARNNNVELNVSAKANQKGYFDTLRNEMSQRYPELSNRIEWKTNDGGDIKVQDLIALAWIPLALITPVKDENNKVIENVAANKLYSAKGSCLKQFEKLMASPEVTNKTTVDYKRELKNVEVGSALRLAVEIPELYDYIYERFPEYYNAADGKYGRITAVRKMNEKRKNKKTPFFDRPVEYLNPEGYIMPLIYGLQALMKNNNGKIEWIQPPKNFLEENLEKIVNRYGRVIKMCEFDPQKVGKNVQIYDEALDIYKMAIAGIH